jgi:hypothetical protein
MLQISITQKDGLGKCEQEKGWESVIFALTSALGCARSYARRRSDIALAGNDYLRLSRRGYLLTPAKPVSPLGSFYRK